MVVVSAGHSCKTDPRHGFEEQTDHPVSGRAALPVPCVPGAEVNVVLCVGWRRKADSSTNPGQHLPAAFSSTTDVCLPCIHLAPGLHGMSFISDSSAAV